MLTMATTKRAVTADELLLMPDDGFRYELLHGELRQTTPPGARHGGVAMRLGAVLYDHVTAHDLGVVLAAETGFLLASNPDHVRAPDASFVRRDRIPQDGLPLGYFPGAPDLAAEVLSPSDTYTEVQDKACDWLQHGTAMVLVVDPTKRTITVYRSVVDVVILDDNDTLDGGDVVPGWSLPVASVFST